MKTIRQLIKSIISDKYYPAKIPVSNSVFMNGLLVGYKTIVSYVIKEEFKRVKGFEENYLISNLGRIVNIKRSKMRALKPQLLKKSGYYRVDLSMNGKRQSRPLVHRLVAEHFIHNDDPINKVDVGHDNRNKKENHVRNLTWCTHIDNAKHWHDDNRSKGIKHKSKKVG